MKGLAVVVVTGDKDLMQIVTDRVTLLDTMKEKASGIREVEERFGVGPDRVIDILGLAGDTSGDFPGVPGWREKTAIKLIREFGTLEALLERGGEVKGKMGRNAGSSLPRRSSPAGFNGGLPGADCLGVCRSGGIRS